MRKLKYEIRFASRLKAISDGGMIIAMMTDASNKSSICCRRASVKSQETADVTAIFILVKNVEYTGQLLLGPTALMPAQPIFRGGTAHKAPPASDPIGSTRGGGAA